MTISKTRRPFAAAALGALGLLLTACNPSSFAAEKAATASALRRVGYPTTTSNQIGCTEDGTVTTGSVTTYLSLCTINTPGVSMQPSQVSTVYSGSSAVATVLVSNKVAIGMPGDLTDYQQVTCNLAEASGSWTVTSCVGPVLISVD